jgi:hypothetical protein
MYSGYHLETQEELRQCWTIGSIINWTMHFGGLAASWQWWPRPELLWRRVPIENIIQKSDFTLQGAIFSLLYYFEPTALYNTQQHAKRRPECDTGRLTDRHAQSVLTTRPWYHWTSIHM